MSGRRSRRCDAELKNRIDKSSRPGKLPIRTVKPNHGLVSATAFSIGYSVRPSLWLLADPVNAIQLFGGGHGKERSVADLQELAILPIGAKGVRGRSAARVAVGHHV